MKYVLTAATGVLALCLGSAHAASPSAPLTVTVIPSSGSTCTSAPCPGSILPAGTSGWVVGFHDEFPGTSINSNNWYVPPDGSSRFGDLQSCSTILSVNNGTLSMVHAGGPDNYGCDISTNQTFGFGYYEASVQTDPNGWGGFWTLNTGNNSCAGGPEYGFEADIIETNIPTGTQNIYWDGYSSCAQRFHGQNNGNLIHDTNFHVYGMWLQPTGMTFYVDGVQTANMSYSFPGGTFNSIEYMILSNTYLSGTTDEGLRANWVRFYHQ